jgi:hypothetical protein
METGAAYYLYTERLPDVTCQYTLHRADYPDGEAYSDFPIESAQTQVRVELLNMDYETFGSLEIPLTEVSPHLLTTADAFDRSIC